MAEKRARGTKRMNDIDFALPKESSKTAAELKSEMDDAVFKSNVERAMRLAHYMHKAFADITDYSNTDCKAYVDALRAVVGSDRLPAGAREQVPEQAQDGNAGPVEDGTSDELAEAIRAAMPGAPGADASREECDGFAADLAALRMKGLTGDANLGRMVRSVFSGMPDTDDEDACREYLSDLAESVSRVGALTEKLERFERMFNKVMELEPEEARTDPAAAKKFEEAWAGYMYGNMSEIEETFRGAMKTG